MHRRAVLVLAVFVLTAACGGGDDEVTSATTTTAAPGVATTATSTTVGPGSTTTKAEAIAVVLGTDRLLVGGNALVLGAPESQATAYLERALGDPTADETQDCDPGRLRALSWKGLTAFVDVTSKTFAGWYAEDGTFATDKGIRVGTSTEAQVRSAYPNVDIHEGSLGTELYVPGASDDGSGLSGVLEGGRVETLWSGATCIAR